MVSDPYLWILAGSLLGGLGLGFLLSALRASFVSSRPSPAWLSAGLACLALCLICASFLFLLAPKEALGDPELAGTGGLVAGVLAFLAALGAFFRKTLGALLVLLCLAGAILLSTEAAVWIPLEVGKAIARYTPYPEAVRTAGGSVTGELEIPAEGEARFLVPAGSAPPVLRLEAIAATGPFALFWGAERYRLLSFGGLSAKDLRVQEGRGEYFPQLARLLARYGAERLFSYREISIPFEALEPYRAIEASVDASGRGRTKPAKTRR